MKRTALSLVLILSLSGCASTGNASKVSDVLLLGVGIAGMIVGSAFGGGALGVGLSAAELLEWQPESTWSAKDAPKPSEEINPTDVILQQ